MPEITQLPSTTTLSGEAKRILDEATTSANAKRTTLDESLAAATKDKEAKQTAFQDEVKRVLTSSLARSNSKGLVLTKLESSNFWTLKESQVTFTGLRGKIEFLFDDTISAKEKDSRLTTMRAAEKTAGNKWAVTFLGLLQQRVKMSAPEEKVFLAAKAKEEALLTQKENLPALLKQESTLAVERAVVAYKSDLEARGIYVKDVGTGIEALGKLQNAALEHTLSQGIPHTGISSEDVTEFLMRTQLDRVKLLDLKIHSVVQSMKKRNLELAKINQYMSDMRAARPDGDADEKALMPEHVRQYLSAQGHDVPAAGTEITQAKFDSTIQSLKGISDGMNNDSQLEMISLQKLTNYRNQAFDMTSNVLSKTMRSKETIIGNMR